MAKLNGEPIFDSMGSIGNPYNQVRQLQLQHGTSLKTLAPTVRAIDKSASQNGLVRTETITVDDCCKSRLANSMFDATELTLLMHN